MTNELGLLIKGGVIVLLALIAGTLYLVSNNSLSFVLALPAIFVAISMRNGK